MISPTRQNVRRVSGVFFSERKELPMPFITSALQHFQPNVQLLLYTNFEPDNRLINESRVKVIPLRSAYSDTYTFFKDHAERSSNKRWYRFMTSFLRLLAKGLISVGLPIPEWLLSFLFTRYSINVCRYFLYWNRQLLQPADRCFYTDVTDVIFQGDIFENSELKESKTYAFQERADIPIQDEIHNATWIKTLYHDSKLFNTVMNATICCSGTILCNQRETIYSFTQDMCLRLLEPRIANFPPGSRKSGNAFVKQNGMHPADQGVLNLLTHEKPERFVRVKNGIGVYTMGIENKDGFEIVDGKIRKKAMEAPAVVHQYNRHSAVNAFVTSVLN